MRPSLSWMTIPPSGSTARPRSMDPTYLPGGGYSMWPLRVQQSRCRALATDLRGTVFAEAAQELAVQAAEATDHSSALGYAQSAVVLWRAAGFKDRPVSSESLPFWLPMN